MVFCAGVGRRVFGEGEEGFGFGEGLDEEFVVTDEGDDAAFTVDGVLAEHFAGFDMTSRSETGKEFVDGFGATGHATSLA